LIYANKIYNAPYKILSIDFLSDFEDNYSDEILLEITLGAGTYANNIYPFKEDIEIILAKTPLNEVDDNIDTTQKPQTERYRATLIDTGNPIIEANSSFSPTMTQLDIANLITVKFQLVNKALEQLRMISVGSIFRNGTVGDVIKSSLTQASQTIVVDGKRAIKGVDVIEPISNNTPRSHIVIPQGIPLVQLPQYIHEKCGGVYSSGLGYYLQGDYWYVYPCYDCTRFNSAKKTVTIINVPKNKLPGIERTYRLTGDNLVILATGSVKFKDNSEVEMLNKGNGVRYADANNFVTGFATTANNKTTASRALNNSEYVSVKRLTGNNNVPVSSNPINANSFYEASKLAVRQGSMIDLEWENSNQTLIFPGMMVKILYIDDTEIKKIYGVMLKAHHYTAAKGQGQKTTRYISHSVLSIFINRVGTS